MENSQNVAGSMVIVVNGGVATLPDGSEVSLLDIQACLNDVFQETGDIEIMRACDALSRITGQHQGLGGEFLPGTYSDELSAGLATPAPKVAVAKRKSPGM